MRHKKVQDKHFAFCKNFPFLHPLICFCYFSFFLHFFFFFVSYTLCIQQNWSLQLSSLHPSPSLIVQTLDLSATSLLLCVMFMRILIDLTDTTFCTMRWASSIEWFKIFVGCYPFNSRQNSAESGFSAGKCYVRCSSDEPMCPTSLEMLQLSLSLTQLVLGLAFSRPARTDSSLHSNYFFSEAEIIYFIPHAQISFNVYPH